MTRRFLPPAVARPMPPEVAALLADAEAAAVGDAAADAGRRDLLDAVLPPDTGDAPPEADADLADLDRLVGARDAAWLPSDGMSATGVGPVVPTDRDGRLRGADAGDVAGRRDGSDGIDRPTHAGPVVGGRAVGGRARHGATPGAVAGCREVAGSARHGATAGAVAGGREVAGSARHGATAGAVAGCREVAGSARHGATAGAVAGGREVAGVGLRGSLVGVVAPAPLVHAAAGGVAASVRRRWKAPVAVVACPCARGTGGPATRRAAALARRLAARGFDASGAAGLCRVVIPEEPLALVAEVRRLVSAVPDGVPVVLGVGGRDVEVDALLASAALLVLGLTASPDPSLAELARASLASVGPPTGEVVVPADPLGRRVTAAGLRPLEPRGVAW